MKRYIVYIEEGIHMTYKRSTRLYEDTELVNDSILLDYLYDSGLGTDGEVIGVYDTKEEARARFDAGKANCRTYRIDWNNFEADLLWLEEEKYDLDENGDINAYEWEIQDSYAQPYVEECEDDEDDED